MDTTNKVDQINIAISRTRVLIDEAKRSITKAKKISNYEKVESEERFIEELEKHLIPLYEQLEQAKKEQKKKASCVTAIPNSPTLSNKPEKPIKKKRTNAFSVKPTNMKKIKTVDQRLAEAGLSKSTKPTKPQSEDEEPEEEDRQFIANSSSEDERISEFEPESEDEESETEELQKQLEKKDAIIEYLQSQIHNQEKLRVEIHEIEFERFSEELSEMTQRNAYLREQNTRLTKENKSIRKAYIELAERVKKEEEEKQQQQEEEPYFPTEDHLQGIQNCLELSREEVIDLYKQPTHHHHYYQPVTIQKNYVSDSEEDEDVVEYKPILSNKINKKKL